MAENLRQKLPGALGRGRRKKRFGRAVLEDRLSDRPQNSESGAVVRWSEKSLCLPSQLTELWREINLVPFDRPQNFYMWNSMGMASSIALGLAIARPDLRVTVLDGDGSLLMNLGTLSTMARYRPGNLLHIVFDNESLLSVGGFPTATATGSDLAGVDLARVRGRPGQELEQGALAPPRRNRPAPRA